MRIGREGKSVHQDRRVCWPQPVHVASLMRQSEPFKESGGSGERRELPGYLLMPSALSSMLRIFMLMTTNTNIGVRAKLPQLQIY